MGYIRINNETRTANDSDGIFSAAEQMFATLLVGNNSDKSRKAKFIHIK